MDFWFRSNSSTFLPFESRVRVCLKNITFLTCQFARGIKTQLEPRDALRCLYSLHQTFHDLTWAADDHLLLVHESNLQGNKKKHQRLARAAQGLEGFISNHYQSFTPSFGLERNSRRCSPFAFTSIMMHISLSLSHTKRSS